MNGQETCVCPNDQCGKTFEHPLQLTVLCNDPVETYPACPYCMSRIENEEEREEREPQEDQELANETPIALKIKTALQKEQERETEEPEEPTAPKCTHDIGYLKKRPKGTSIPDECLVCPKMIQCLSG